MQPVQINTTQI